MPRRDSMSNRALRPSRKHGMHGTPTYKTWQAMLARCLYPSTNKYELYGGAGIRVCDRWRVFENFLADMGVRPEGCTLDRIDSKGNYELANCRWATPKEQSANSSQPHWITFDGVTLHVSGWAKRLGLPQPTLAWRLAHGWPLERALKGRA